MKFLISFLLLGFFPPISTADSTETGFWSVQLENDLFGDNNDRFYTHGTKVSFASDGPAPKFLRRISDILPFYQKGERQIYFFDIGQTIFTPEDIDEVNLIEDDRPYAGWLFLNSVIGNVVEDRGDREVLNGIILTIGLVGPGALAEETQEGVHSLFNATNPKGWENQLENELGINVAYIRKWRRIFAFDEPTQTEINHHLGLTLGNVYSYASAGIMARYGTHLKTDLGPPTISPGFPGTPSFNYHRKSNWYIFAGIEARAMARNIFLDGNTFQDSHSVDKEIYVADLQLGVAFHFKDMRLAFSQIFRTREFDTQPEPAQYGAINLTFFTD